MRFDRMSGLDPAQLDELEQMVSELLEEPWDKGEGRPRELALREALVVTCGYLRQNIIEDVWADIFGVHSSLKASRCQAGFRPAVSRLRRCLRACGNGPGSPFLRAGAVFVRAGELGQGPGGARPPVAAPEASLTAGRPRADDRGPAEKGPCGSGFACMRLSSPHGRACGRAACWLRSSLRLSPGVPGEHGAGSRSGRAGSITGAPAPPRAGGRMNGGLAPGRRPGQVMRPARAGEHGGRARRASRRRPGSAAPGRRRPWRCSSLPCRGGR